MTERTTARGPRALAGFVPPLVRTAFGRRGFVEAGILTDWPEIVGAEIARWSAPQRLSFPHKGGDGATLHVTVSGGYATELQHLAPVVIERVNRFFGYRAVDRLALSQGEVAAPPAPESPPPATETPPAIENIEDEALRAALGRLARAVLAAGGGR